MATLILIEGPVGAGKSTYAAKLTLQRQAVHLNLDEWMVTLFQKDRPEQEFMAWYNERKQRCIGSTHRMVVSDEIFELANNAWIAPDDREHAQQHIQIIST